MGIPVTLFIMRDEHTEEVKRRYVRHEGERETLASAG